MRCLGFFRSPAPASPQRATVSFDDQSVTCRRPGGLVETVRWSDLQIIFIQTTDKGPAVDDVFWVLGGGDSGCVVPSEAEGMDLLLPRLQHLPNFDNNAAIAAMSCVENREFLCWQRPKLGELDGEPDQFGT
jgi:hypothetical protein